MKRLILFSLLFVITKTSFSQQTATFKDVRDDRVYKTVKIGNQTWMAENLAFKTYSNCWAYDNDQNFVAKYGYLYNWEATKNACPAGWHLPGKEEFEALINNCGGSAEAAYKALFPGGSSGFSARFGGLSLGNGVFGEVGEYAYLWSSYKYAGHYEDEETGEVQYYESVSIFEMKSSYLTASMVSSSLWFGFSVRCLKDN
jgi:uncharacterized protein (TIGR02145 family)